MASKSFGSIFETFSSCASALHLSLLASFSHTSLPGFNTSHLTLDAPTESESWAEPLGVNEDLGSSSKSSQHLELICQTLSYGSFYFFCFLAWLPLSIPGPSFCCLVLSSPPWISPWKYNMFQNDLTDFLSFVLPLASLLDPQPSSPHPPASDPVPFVWIRLIKILF